MPADLKRQFVLPWICQMNVSETCSVLKRLGVRDYNDCIETRKLEDSR